MDNSHWDPVSGGPAKTRPPFQFKGVWIPASIWLNTELTDREKFLLAQIHYFTREDEPCYASNEYLSEFMGTTIKTIKNMLVILKKKGYIKNYRNRDGYREMRAVFPEW